MCQDCCCCCCSYSFVCLFVCWVVCLFVCLFIEDDFTLKETVEDGLRMALRPACAKIVQSLSSLCDIWCPGFCFIKSFPFVNTHCIEEQNTQGPTPSNQRQDHEDHSTYAYPFRADTYRETYQTSIDRWSSYVLKTKVRAHTLRNTWLRKDSFIKIHARNISCT